MDVVEEPPHPKCYRCYHEDPALMKPRRQWLVGRLAMGHAAKNGILAAALGTISISNIPHSTGPEHAVTEHA